MPYPEPITRTRFSHLAGAVGAGLLDFLYPRLCWVCEEPLPAEAPRTGLHAWFCKGCEEGLTRIEPPFCSTCGEAFDGAMETEFQCWNCEGRKLHFDYAISRFKAEGQVRELIHRLKYNRQIALRGAVGELLLEVLNDSRLRREELSQWLLVPVPLHPARQKDRQFNQSWELCRMLSRRTGIPAASILRRTHFTNPQAGLSRAQRLQNIRHLFTLKRSWPWAVAKTSPAGRNILLVDDVLTTGATANECARILKQEGKAQKVVVITAARG